MTVGNETCLVVGLDGTLIVGLVSDKDVIRTPRSCRITVDFPNETFFATEELDGKKTELFNFDFEDGVREALLSACNHKVPKISVWEAHNDGMVFFSIIEFDIKK